MGLNTLLRDADPNDFARAAKVMARDTLSDPHERNERAIRTAKKVMAMSHQELIDAKPGYDARWDARHKKS
jgi:hypothetical protein